MYCFLDTFQICAQSIDNENFITHFFNFVHCHKSTCEWARGKSFLFSPFLSPFEKYYLVDAYKNLLKIKTNSTNSSFQANENLAQYGRPRTTPTKVKVRPGSTASQQRTPVKKERLLVIPEVDQRRDYAGFLLQQRIDNIDVRHKTEVMKLYLPYIQTTPSSWGGILCYKCWNHFNFN